VVTGPLFLFLLTQGLALRWRLGLLFEYLFFEGSRIL